MRATVAKLIGALTKRLIEITYAVIMYEKLGYNILFYRKQTVIIRYVVFSLLYKPDKSVGLRFMMKLGEQTNKKSVIITPTCRNIKMKFF
jgi:hypothetical protein